MKILIVDRRIGAHALPWSGAVSLIFIPRLLLKTAAKVADEINRHGRGFLSWFNAFEIVINSCRRVGAGFEEDGTYSGEQMRATGHRRGK
jgi:hypothetical protein